MTTIIKPGYLLKNGEGSWTLMEDGPYNTKEEALDQRRRYKRAEDESYRAHIRIILHKSKYWLYERKH